MPADLALTTFGDIAEPNPFGSLGDLRLVPDDQSRITLPASAGRPATDLVLASIFEPDGRPWACCPRQALVDALGSLAERGLFLRVAFEQEFGLLGLAGSGHAAPFSIEAHRRAEPFGTELVATLHAAGLEPETWLPEYGQDQYEITLAQSDALRAADRAILVRALVRDLAAAHDLRATFVPLRSPDAVGNGVHIHLSLWGAEGRPLTLADGDRDGTTLSKVAGRFVAGLLAHAPALIAWTAPSVISALRLGPHRWSSAAAFLGLQNREALVRICPLPTLGGADREMVANVEYRACDATANPWLALAALVRAGLSGLHDELPPAVVVEGELAGIPESEWPARGISPLPLSLHDALAALEADDAARSWFAPDLLATHLGVRRTEARLLADVSPEGRCSRYADVI